MVGYPFACVFFSEFRNQRLGLLFFLAHEFLDAVQSAFPEEFPRSHASYAVEAILGADDWTRTFGGPSLVPVGKERGSPARYPRMDVLLHDVLDVVRPFWSSEFV